MTPERVARIQSVLAKRQPDLMVLTDKISKQQNISAILRSCDAVGIQDLHVIEADQNYKVHHRTSGGSSQWVRQHQYPNSQSALATLKKQGVRFYGAQLSDRAIDYRQVDYTQPCALVLGAEKYGISDEVADACDEHIIIPMVGMVESFNVSAAASIILTEAYYQREQAGLYQGPSRLPPDDYQNLMFRWCHPKLAEFCLAKGLAFPPIDEEGHLIEPAQWYQQIKEPK